MSNYFDQFEETVEQPYLQKTDTVQSSKPVQNNPVQKPVQNNDYFSRFEKTVEQPYLSSKPSVTPSSQGASTAPAAVPQNASSFLPDNGTQPASSVNKSSASTNNQNKPQPIIEYDWDKFKENARNIGRAILPESVENKIWGSKEDEEWLKKHNENNTLEYQDILKLYREGKLNAEAVKRLSENKLKLDTLQADKEYRDVRNTNVAKGAFDLGLAVVPFSTAPKLLQGATALSKTGQLANIAKNLTNAQKLKYAKQIEQLAQKRAADAIKKNLGIKVLAHAADGTLQGAGIMALDYGLDNVLGRNHDRTLGQSLAQGALTGAGLGAGLPVVGAIAGRLGRTAAAQKIAEGYNNLLNSETKLGNKLANWQGTIADALNLKAGNKTAQKYKDLNSLISRGTAPIEKQFTKEQNDLIKLAENLPEEESKRIMDILSGEDVRVQQSQKSKGQLREEAWNAKREQRVKNGLEKIEAIKKQIEERKRIAENAKNKEVQERLNTKTPLKNPDKNETEIHLNR